MPKKKAQTKSKSKGGGGSGRGLVRHESMELAKAKKLACAMGGAWHANPSEVAPQITHKKETSANGGAAATGTTATSTKDRDQNADETTTLRRSSSGVSAGDAASIDNSNSSRDGGGGRRREHLRRRRSNVGNAAVRRPADGRSPGRKDPIAVAKAEAEAAARMAEAAAAVGDPSWRLPTDVDYYTDRAALLRELVKEMPAEKRLSFQTRVANARTKEEVEGVMEDFAPRLECLVLPHARSREVDLQQVKKDTARERVVLDGKEIVFWESPSDQPHSWHDELWATVEGRVTEVLVGSAARGGSADREGGQGERTRNQAPVPSAEWNKARIADTTSEVFKAMSRTGAGGDAYFALVALFCTADKMVVPVHCQESPITVEFHQPHDTGNKSTGFFGSSSTGRSRSWGSFHGSPSDSGGSRGGGAEDAHIVVTVPSTFDIYLRDGHLQSPRANGSSGITSVGRGGGSARGGGRGGDFHGGRRRGAGMNGKGVANGRDGLSVGGINGDHGGTDASAAVHLVRVKAVVEEEIPVVRSKKTPALSVNGLSGNRASSAPVGDMAAAAASGRQNVTMSSQQGSDWRAEHSSQAATAAVPSPGSVLARTQRRMRVSIVPEPSAMTQMMHSLSRKIGVGDGTGPEPPRVLGM